MTFADYGPILILFTLDPLAQPRLTALGCE